MKIVEMTNEELADWIAIVSGSVVGPHDIRGAYLREAAARLRRPTPVDDDLLKMARDIDRLRARLKVAEDALVACRDGMCGECHRQYPGWICANECYEMGKAKDALAAIRGEGATNG